jgi:DNA topoisomerase-6 subunit B
MPAKSPSTTSRQATLFEAAPAPAPAHALGTQPPEAEDVETPPPAPAAASKRPAGRAPAREDAQTMAARQREISVSEFFTKNRHLLGFDNPQKALLTTIPRSSASCSTARSSTG